MVRRLFVRTSRTLENVLASVRAVHHRPRHRRVSAAAAIGDRGKGRSGRDRRGWPMS
jgi:hypothetical protein